MKVFDILLQGRNQIHLSDGKTTVGRVLERGKGLEQTLVYPKALERRKHAKDILDLGMIHSLEKIPPLSHPFGTKVMKMGRRQRTGITARGGHGHKKLKK